MDPNMALHEAREAASEILASEPPDMEDDEAKLARLERMEVAALVLASRFDALDGWMTKQGFTPHAWRETEDHR